MQDAYKIMSEAELLISVSCVLSIIHLGLLPGSINLQFTVSGTCLRQHFTRQVLPFRGLDPRYVHYIYKLQRS